MLLATELLVQETSYLTNRCHTTRAPQALWTPHRQKKIGARLCNLAILTKIGAIVYTLHRFECWCVVVVNENTRFHLTSDASIWLRPMAAEHCSWEPMTELIQRPALPPSTEGKRILLLAGKWYVVFKFEYLLILSDEWY